MEATRLLTRNELEAQMDYICQSPADGGLLKMIVRRPQVDEREVVSEAEIDLAHGLIGDTWEERGSGHTPDGSANPAAQVTVMNARVIEVLAQDEARWPLAGDQLFVDMDLSEDNLPPGTRLAVGTAILEVSAVPHTGCKKFSARFGVEALAFISTPEGKRLHMRGINTQVVQSGTVRVGDAMRKIDGTHEKD